MNDSDWLFGTSAFINNQVRPVAEDIDIEEREVGGSVKVGRRIIELVHASLTYRISQFRSTTRTFVLDKLRRDGIKSSAIFALSRNSTNNYLDPTQGTKVVLSQNFTGGPLLRGNFKFMETSLDGSWYIPWDFTDTYRTYFHLRACRPISIRCSVIPCHCSNDIV